MTATRNGIAALTWCRDSDIAVPATRRAAPAFEERAYTESSDAYLTGGVNDHWFAPNLTADPGSGLGRVPAEHIASFLKNGHGGGLVTFGSMVQVVEDSTQYLSDDDLSTQSPAT